MSRSTAVVTAELGTLFEREGDRIFGFLLARCGSRSVAEDLTAETFLSASRRVAAGGGADVTRGWLFTVARRRLVDHWRAQGAQRRRFDRLIAGTRPKDISIAPDSPDSDPAVELALESLPDRYRAVLVLRYLDDFSVSEVADALELSYKATESVLSRARAAFSSAYQEQCVD